MGAMPSAWAEEPPNSAVESPDDSEAASTMEGKAEGGTRFFLTPDSPSAVTISQQQLDAYAELFSQPNERVLRQLRSDPGLMPLADAAVDVRKRRERNGKGLTVLGFTVLGLGTGVAIYYILSQPVVCWDSACRSSQNEHQQTATTVGLISAGVGLAIAIPGIILWALRSDAEDKAIDRFQRSRPQRSPMAHPEFSQASQAVSPGQTLNLPILSFRF
jgi:hypothetical protein